MASGAKTHRVADLFCGDGIGNISDDFEEWAHFGRMSTVLRTWITAFQLCCLDDGIQESPHGIITAIASAKVRSLPPCWSAFYRFKQNHETKRSLDILVPGRFNSLFHYWRSLFCKKSLVGRSKIVHVRKGIPKDFAQKVFRMNDYAFSSIGTMKADQDRFLHCITDSCETLTNAKKIFREYLRMVLSPRDIISILPEGCPFIQIQDGADSDTGAAPPPLHEPPIVYSIIASDQYRLKTIRTSDSRGDWDAPAPFMVSYSVI